MVTDFFTVIRGAMAQYAVMASRMIVPLMLLPILAHRLDAHEFSLYLYAQGLTIWLMTLVEYGHNLSITKDIGHRLGKGNQWMGRDVGEVLGAKVLLAILTLLVVIVLMICGTLERRWTLGVWSWLQSVAMGIMPLFFFHGHERMHVSAVIEVIVGLVVLITILMMVPNETSADWPTAIQSIVRSMGSLVAIGLMVRSIGFVTPSWTESWRILRKGFSVFIYQFSASLYAAGNIILLGFMVPVTHVGIYAGADRIVRAGAAVLIPLSQALFPRLCRLQNENPKQAQMIRLWALTIMVVMGIFGAITISIFAPFLITFILGPQMISSVSVVRIMVWIIPLVAISNIFGVQYLLIQNKDRAFRSIVFFVGLTNVVVAPISVMFFGIVGMAYTLVFIEMIVVILMGIAIRKSRSPVK